MRRDLNDLYYYVEVVEHGGFAPAGRVLGVPKSKLSRHVAVLEERLGVRLIQRSTRRFSVTDVGQVYYAHCKAMLVEADAADEAVALAHSEPRGMIRMTCPVALLDASVGQMVANFMARHALVNIHLEETNRRVDVVGEGMDIAIRVRPPPLEDSELVMRILGRRRQCLVASPALLAREGRPRKPDDLRNMPSMGHGLQRGDFTWHLLGPDNEEVVVRHQPRLVTRGLNVLRDAALQGVGVVRLPHMMISSQLARGELVNVLPGWEPPCEIMHAVFASRRGQLPAVRALLDFLVESFAAQGQE
ncbi:LysR family transcriptional regulator [Kerstersia gyiorum]|uniref:LysR family transcriptional regulator n=1 Tax=Kerstersia gyiorum TaxID=206506 RepID=UPI00209E56F1|nr:LysR family transcriptional regulator [Kerstersia gyiorum]MCP1635523.1 DNA-binding transcriptional LysR family regulator [Kerstersia gyiorum]MCP1669549.1 DNA-binding transcriptional LysR family regulator [Kerstersia gyiorum]MCP1707454.1 DNA-binding transcriptional LysR family regulator [Kerstersia gyiorum]